MKPGSKGLGAQVLIARYAFVALVMLAAGSATAEQLGGGADEQAGAKLAAALQELLGHEFRVHTTPHFLIAYDTDESFARRRGGLLEGGHEQFYQTFTRAKLTLHPIERRLVCILFREHSDYEKYARAADGELMAYAGGYYSTRTNRIAFHDDHTSPQFGETEKKIDILQTRIAQLRRRIEELHRSGQSAADDERELKDALAEHRWLSNRLDIVASGSNDAKTTHEAIHQLAFNSGLQDRRVEYPFWLTEGLATAFEGSGGTGTAGGDNAWRRRALVEAHKRGKLMALKDLVAMDRLPDDLDHQRAGDLYSQSWGLFRFLFGRKNQGMRQYLESVRQAAPGHRDGVALRAEFESAFGSIARVEREFSAYLRLLR